MKILDLVIKILGKLIGGILAIIGFSLVCWLIGLFYHFSWWLSNCMGTCDSFNFDSGLIKYTLPYALMGLLIGIVVFVGIVKELFENLK